MLQLSKSKKYISDLEYFNKCKDLIPSPKLKTEFEKLLKEFKHQASLIDGEHSTYNKGYPNPGKSKEYVTKLTETRKRMYKIVSGLDK